MTERRFFVRPEDVLDERLLLRAEEAHHARRVLRLRVGDEIVCFDGEGRAWTGVIREYARDAAIVGELAALAAETEPLPRVTLGQAVLKPERMDLVIQKAVELGASRVVPLLAERSVGAERVGRREERWRRIALEAAKQCERNRVPPVEAAVPPETLLARADGVAIAFVERSERTATRLEPLGPVDDVTILIGPEGGWSPGERERMREAGVVEASLGGRILRAETAAIAALAVVGYALGR